ncbi:MAG TPA: RNA polymerase sigma factor [Candidatus Microbacterium stercoravium]|uniref:RNA polymerase sigma factor n=1 Tax=Candidatus Microbacterium stercoravium TaxID=2838697 RepID=A0A9D2KI65_9MICO|nr:RNA polymerase sigma factor [Candidatus Microbacterium stercoravium]
MGMTRTDELVRALDAADARAASRAADELVAAGYADEALDALAERAASSRSALELLVETLDTSGVVHRFVGSMLLDRDAIDDVAQDTLISVVQSIASYRGGGRFTSWVHPIVRRRVADHLRRQRETTTLDEELLPTARMSSMIATRATVQQALADLPELYRIPVMLRDVHGLTYAQVAERTGRTLGTVKSQISRGRAMVAGMLTEDGEPA